MNESTYLLRSVGMDWIYKGGELCLKIKDFILIHWDDLFYFNKIN